MLYTCNNCGSPCPCYRLPYVHGLNDWSQDVLINGPLGKSGFLAAFSLIFLSEIGDKTFFIAALLAMKLGRWVAFLGSVSSLAVMTLISVSIGAVFSRVREIYASHGIYCNLIMSHNTQMY